MTRETQSVLLTITGIVLVRMATGDTYLRYVNEWMQWPLIICGLLLVLLGLLDVLRPERKGDGHGDHSSGVPRAAWLLFAPSVVFFLVAPPALGASFAERAQTVQVPVEEGGEVTVPALPADDPAPLLLDEVMYRAVYGAETLAGRRVELTGFASHDADGWYVTQFSMNCCAADAFVMRVGATGVEAPPDDQWVRVVGTYVDGTGSDGTTPPVVQVESVEHIKAPANQYQ